MSIRPTQTQRHGRAWRSARWPSPASASGRRGRRQKPVKMAMIAPLSGPWARQGQLMRHGRRHGDRRDQPVGRHQGAGRRQVRAGRRRCRRQHREGQERGAAPVGRAARPGRRLRLLAQLVHAGGDRGHRAGAAAVADPVLFRRDHQSRLQIHLPDLADRRLAGRRDRADRRSNLAEKATGKRPKTIGILQDNTASPVSFGKQLREGGGLEKAGLKAVVDEIFTPPLVGRDAAGRARSARPSPISCCC